MVLVGQFIEEDMGAEEERRWFLMKDESEFISLSMRDPVDSCEVAVTRT